jgi:hypothetical protein
MLTRTRADVAGVSGIDAFRINPSRNAMAALDRRTPVRPIKHAGGTAEQSHGGKWQRYQYRVDDGALAVILAEAPNWDNSSNFKGPCGCRRSP